MLAKIRTSMVMQSNILFFVSIIIIAHIWFVFYLLLKHQHEEHCLERYTSAYNYLEPKLKKDKKIPTKVLESFHLEILEKPDLQNYQELFKRELENEGFKIIKLDDENIIRFYTSEKEFFFKDLNKNNHMNLLHGLFIFLFIAQIVLHLKISSFLFPLAKISSKLKKLKEGDRSPLDISSKYDEINLITSSYNESIKRINYMLETREMFNKIFMHEIKMPLAKGMFYLKQVPSKTTHDKLKSILSVINEELEEFSQIEMLISHENDINNEEHTFTDILNTAISRASLNKGNIELETSLDGHTLKGDKDFWVLCIKNILDNAVKYSTDKKIVLGFNDGLYFKNYGEPLPVDISQKANTWKIEKNKRHESSTGYGFGLFIIKNIILYHKYNLDYTYDKKRKQLTLKIS